MQTRSTRMPQRIRKMFAAALVCVMIVYYYLYVISSQLTVFLPAILVVGIALSGIIVIDTFLVRKLTRGFVYYALAYVTILGLSVCLQWPNIAWLIVTSTALWVLSRREFVLVFFYASVVFYIAVVVMALLGYLPLVYVGFDGADSERYGMLKYSLGFDGPNQASLSFFPILMSGMYLYGRRRFFAAIALLVSIIIGLVTGSRTGLCVDVLFVVVYWCVLRKEQKSKNKRSKILPYLFVLLFFVSCLTASSLANNDLANNVLSHRPAWITYYLDSSYTPSAVGSDEVYNKAEYQTPPVDNFPVYIYARYGVVGFILFAAVFWGGMRNMESKKMRLLFLFIMLYGLSEAFFDIAAKNIVLPMLIASLFQKEGVAYGEKYTLAR